MTSLNKFRASRRIVTPEQFSADDMRPVDLEFYPKAAAIHAYDGKAATYYILEMPDGWHFEFHHPCDSVASTRERAEQELYSAYVGIGE